MKNDFFRRIVGTQKWFVMRSENQKDLLVENTNKLLWEDAAIEGVKTGYTRAAGRCFVGSRNENGTRLISVVLGSDDWGKDTKTLFDWGFNEIEVRARYQKGQVIGKVPVSGAFAETADVRVNGDIAIFSPAASAPLEIAFTPHVAPIKEGDLAGTLRFTDASGKLTEYPVVFAEHVGAKPLLLAMAGNWKSWAVLGLVGVVAAGFRGRRRPLRRRSARAHAR